MKSSEKKRIKSNESNMQPTQPELQEKRDIK